MPAAVKPELIEQDNYEVALRLAQERWRLLDPRKQAARSGARARLADRPAAGAEGGRQIVSLVFMGKSVEVTHPDGCVSPVEDGVQVPLWEQILIMHYLCSERPIPSTDRVIAYSEIPDGRFYDAAYQRRTKLFLLKVFGAQPERLVEAGRSLNAEPATMGDIALRVRAFPMVDIYLSFWRGDDEFPPDASVLLGERIQGFLDAEDSAVLAGLVVGYLARAAAGAKNNK